MNNSKAAIIISQIIEKIQIISGGFWTFIFGMVFLMFCVDDYTDDVGDPVGVLAVTSVFLGLSVYTVWCGIKRKKMRLLFKQYVAYLSVNPRGDLSDLASSTGTSVKKLKKNIRFMLKKRFFNSAYIDEDDNQLVVTTIRQKQGFQSQQNVVYRPCRCPYCDGSNMIAVGTTARCDYCGSFLQG